MSRTLKIYQGEDLTPVRDLTEPSSDVHVIWEEIEAGGKAYKGESSISTFPMRDERGETGSPANLPADLTHISLAAGNRLEWLVNGIRLFRGRIGPKDYSRGDQKADRAREVTVSAQDTNFDLRGIIVDGWDRGEETDTERALALVDDYLTGDPRVTTNIATTYVATGSNTVTLGPKVYDATTPAEILSEIALIANKLHFVTIDDELFYDGWDSTAYQAGIRISDRIDEATPEASVLPCPGTFESVGSLGSNDSDDGTNFVPTSVVVSDDRCERVELTLDHDIPVGHSIVIIGGSHQQAATYGIGDDQGNTYSQAAFFQEDSGDPFAAVRIFYGNVTEPLSSGDKLYYEVGVGTSLNNTLERGGKCISAWEFSGAIASGTQSGGTEAAVTTTPSVTVGAGDLIVAAGDENGGASGFPDTITEDGDWTAFDQASTTASSFNAAQIWGGWRLNDEDGETYSATIDQARDWAMAGAVFTVVGAGGEGEGLATFPPIWDVGPSSTEDGMQLLSGLRLYYGQGSNTYVYVSDPVTANQYWHSEESLYTSDPAINTPAKATTMAQAILQRRKTEDRTYNVSIGPLNEDQVGCLKPGHLINIKARAIPDADDLFVTRRIAQLRWTTPVPGMYFAHMMLDRPLKEAPYGVGPKSSTDSINRHVEQGSNSHPEYVLRGTLVTQGDLPYRGASDWTRLAIGASNTFLKSIGTVPVWSPVAPGGGVTDHGALTGLADDDHPQYQQDLGWFDVTAYGATGDGTTDDTSDINNAIAALNSAGRGVLYFPAGDYLISAGLTAITANATIRGDGPGGGGRDMTEYISRITCSDGAVTVFDVQNDTYTFENLNLQCSDTTPTAGAGIAVTAGGDHGRFHRLTVDGFYIDVDVQEGAEWTMSDCHLQSPGLYALKVRHVDLPDGGDWGITNTQFIANNRNATSGIRIEGAGGGRIVGCKINGTQGAATFTTGIDVAVATGIDTTVLLVSNNSIENVTGDAISVTSTGTGQWRSMVFSSNQFGLWSNNSGYAISIAPSNTNDVEDIVISSNLFHTDGTARAAVELVNTDNITLVGNELVGFNDLYDQTGSTNITEVGTVSAAEDVTIADAGGYFTGTDVEAALQELGADISSGSGGHFELLMTGSSPPEPLEDGTGTDWLYVWVND